MIDEEKALEIASNYMEENGATAGTPRLKEIGDDLIYIVPVIVNNQVRGEIHLHSETGENLGGAGC